MATQVGPYCKSGSAALRVVGVPTELPGGSPSTSSSCSCPSSALHKPCRILYGCREGGNWVARNRVGQRAGGALLVRANSDGNKPGQNESRGVYDAFFLGKALAETLNERVGSAIGEFLSDVGRRQAEQQKQIREFQDEVQERAAATAVKAAKKAIAIEKENAVSSTTPSSTSTSTQPPPSTSGLSNPEDAPTSISIEE